MKIYGFTLLLLSILLIAACKQGTSDEKAEDATSPATKSLLEKLADVHGFEHWKDLNRIEFTFNVDRDTVHYERSWIWDVRINRVTMISAGDSLSFLRSEVDSTTARADASFVNDKYWFLAPYQWVWDRENFTHTFGSSAIAPISGDTMQRLTIVYGQEGGYTPGDAYDFYLGKDSVLREWVFRKGNQPEPSLATTWEGYQDHNGLSLSTIHKNNQSSYKLYFTGIAVE